jgi:small-conductance mechanosensitive channel
MTDKGVASSRIPKGRLLLVGVPAVLMILCLVATYLTRGVMSHLPFLNGQAGGEQIAPQGADLVDQKPWQTVAALAPLAVSAEEQGFAREAERLADHEVDQAFAMALRQATMESRVLTGPALELQQKVAALAALVKEDQARVDGLSGNTAGKTKAPASGPVDDLEVAKAQLQLDTDELNDATEDLNRTSGDKRTRIQQELAARQAAMKKYDTQESSGGQMAVISVRRYATLAGRIGAWFDQRTRMGLLEQAKSQTDADVAAMSAQHSEVDRKASAMASKMKDSSGALRLAAGDPSSKSTMAGMAQMHTMAEMHSILDDRLASAQQLSKVYGGWIAQVDLQHRIVAHLILQSITAASTLVLLGVLLWWGAQMLLDRSNIDHRSLHTLRTISSLGIQLITLVLVLLIIFGAPSQVPTILGLGAAGLTVVFQDFILAFFGWFVLMGRSGIRVGDWVEINGVGGEVVEIGLFRTALLETGNWTDKGHPTGRRVTFINNFAVSGQFFNFSTAGQWMWDEISLNVPPGDNIYKTIQAIHEAVIAQTADDAKLAEAEWKSVTRQRGVGQFSATPSVDLRPAASGIEVLVRYVTRAGDRFEIRNRLFQTVLELLHKPEAIASETQTDTH